MSGKVSFPESKLGDNYPAAIKTMLERGQDPKEMLIEFCRPGCKAFQEKQSRCEAKLKEVQAHDPEASCMYPLRDWVTCIEACVQPKIHAQLVGNKHGTFF